MKIYGLQLLDIEDKTTKKIWKNTIGPKVLANICLMIKPCTYVYVRLTNNARNLTWLNLQKIFIDKKDCLEDLVTLACRNKIANFKNMKKLYVNEIMSISQKLNMDAPLDDEFVAVIMLNGLSEEWSYDDGSRKCKLSSNFVKAKFL